MAATVSVIGRTTRVRGRITGATDLEIRGLVDGEIAVSGDVTVDSQGIVGAGVRGRRVVVRGAVKGDLVGQEAIVVENGARVVGDVRAPRVAIAPGALVRGFVETGDETGASARLTRTQPVGRGIPAVTARPVPASATKAPAPAAAVSAAAPPYANATRSTANQANAPGNSSSASVVARRPPPPVVPALKKAKGQIAKRKER